MRFFWVPSRLVRENAKSSPRPPCMFSLSAFPCEAGVKEQERGSS